MGETADIRYEIPAHVLARSVGDDTVLLDLHQDEYFSLDRVATSIWTLLEAGEPAGAIVRKVIESYGIDAETAERDVADLLRSLLDAGLIVGIPLPG